MLKEKNWEPEAEIVNRSSIEEIREALNDEIDEGIAEIEKGDSVLIRLTRPIVSYQPSPAVQEFEDTLLGWQRPIGD